ncbi:DUF892 family protein [Tunturiibacter lichenicola]|uniref:DUF892 family protein n=1 Tax=Tunturiibacter lichenicola TaxID=2051959 RepID=UPI003D9BE6A9
MSTHPSVEKFKDLFEEELETLYFAESQLLKALPLVKKGVFNKELAHVLVQQTAQTKIYVKSLKSALNHLGRRVSITRNATSEAMLSELTHLVKRFPRGNLRDAALLALLQRLEHHRAARYLSTIALAKQMGEEGILDFLKEAASFDSVSAKRFAQIALQVNAEAFIDTHSERCPPAVPPLT